MRQLDVAVTGQHLRRAARVGLRGCARQLAGPRKHLAQVQLAIEKHQQFQRRRRQPRAAGLEFVAALVRGHEDVLRVDLIDTHASSSILQFAAALPVIG
ncbi:MAG: hypothetical protein FJY55_15780, partial [Betaproteobacteria bacterium]|nr:hypothetical protein [Betaproteobacteria bacterium]